MTWRSSPFVFAVLILRLLGSQQGHLESVPHDRGNGILNDPGSGRITGMGSFTETVAGVSLEWAAATDKGPIRARNEDAVLALPGFYTVADGMGGHFDGQRASGAIVDHLRAVGVKGPKITAAEITAALEAADSDISTWGSGKIMGSTVTGLALCEDESATHWLVWHVGDSRLYKHDGSKLSQVTRDHTIVQELLDDGSIAEEQVAKHPDRHVITRAVGTEDSLPPDFFMLAPQPGESFLLCSDGLTNVVSDAQISESCTSHLAVRTVVDDLLATALAQGARDNVSIVMVRCGAVSSELPDFSTAYAELDITQPRPALLQKYAAESKGAQAQATEVRS